MEIGTQKKFPEKEEKSLSCVTRFWVEAQRASLPQNGRANEIDSVAPEPTRERSGRSKKHDRFYPTKEGLPQARSGVIFEAKD